MACKQRETINTSSKSEQLRTSEMHKHGHISTPERCHNSLQQVTDGAALHRNQGSRDRSSEKWIKKFLGLNAAGKQRRVLGKSASLGPALIKTRFWTELPLLLCPLSFDAAGPGFSTDPHLVRKVFSMWQKGMSVPNAA